MSHSQNELEMPGRPREVDVDDVAAVVREYAGEPIVASTVAEEIDCDRRTATRRLREAAALPDDVPDSEAVPGLRTKLVGGNARVYWWDQDRDRDRDRDATAAADTAARDRRESAVTRSADPDDGTVAADPDVGEDISTPREDASDDTAAPETEIDTDDADTATIDTVLEDWDPGENVSDETARTEARRAAVWLRDQDGRRTKREFIAALVDGVDDTPGERVWWERAVRPALRQLEAAGLVEYRAGHHDYRWIGDRD